MNRVPLFAGWAAGSALVALGSSGAAVLAQTAAPPGSPPSAASVAVKVPEGPVSYVIDPNHTYPTFESDHRGISTWIGKFNKTTGTVVLDRTAKTGTVDITVEIGSINFGLDRMNEHALSADIFDAAKYPTATYSGKFSKFNGDVPTEVQGNLTLHGITQPVSLSINRFACRPGAGGKLVCGGDASTTFNRADFGISFGVQTGLDPTTRLLIQVEAAEQKP